MHWLETPLKKEQVHRYLKAIPLINLEDIDLIKSEVESGNIVILRITPLAKRNVKDLKEAINRIKEYIERVGGDIARLGEERVVITPSKIRIWRG